MNEIVVLDACVLVPYNLSSLLLALAEEELFEPRWSEMILEETQRALVTKLGKPLDKVERRLHAMRAAFPEATVHGSEWLEPGLMCHPKDRHVLATVIAAEATTIVTTNLKDFPEEACQPHDIAAVHPEAFLLELLSTTGVRCAEIVRGEAARRRQPPQEPEQLLAGLTDIVPTFANTLHQVLLDGVPPTSDVPAYVAVPDDETPLSDWAREHEPTNPLHVALAWWTALGSEQDRDVLEALTHEPAAFGDYQWAVELLEHRSIASRVYRAVDAPNDLAFVRFVPEVAQSSRTFAAFTVRGAAYMSLVKREDASWRVWGLGDLMVGWRTVRD